MKRGKPLKRRTPMRAQRPKPRRRPALRCAGWNACKARIAVWISEAEGYCKTHAMRLADKLVGTFIKTRDRACLHCGKRDDLEWAHIRSRGMKFIRYDLDNSVALCRGHHFYFTRNPGAWDLWVEERWPGKLSELTQREAAAQRAGGHVDLAAVIANYRQAA